MGLYFNIHVTSFVAHTKWALDKGAFVPKYFILHFDLTLILSTLPTIFFSYFRFWISIKSIASLSNADYWVYLNIKKNTHLSF